MLYVKAQGDEPTQSCPGARVDAAVEQNQDYKLHKLLPPTHLLKHHAQHGFGFWRGVFLPNSICSWSKSRDGDGGDEPIPKTPAAARSPAGGSRNLKPQAKGWSHHLPPQPPLSRTHGLCPHS